MAHWHTSERSHDWGFTDLFLTVTNDLFLTAASPSRSWKPCFQNSLQTYPMPDPLPTWNCIISYLSQPLCSSFYQRVLSLCFNKTTFMWGAWVAQSVERRLRLSHDLAVCEFEPRVGLCADSSEPRACFRFCVPLSLCPSPTHALSLCLRNKH